MNEEDYNMALKMKDSNKVKFINGVGIDLSKFKPEIERDKKSLRNEYSYNGKDFILIYIGELSNRKNQNLLLEVMTDLKEEIPNIKLLSFGNGPLEDVYKQKVKDLEFQGKAGFLGYRVDIPNLMKISDIAVSSSKQEGLPVICLGLKGGACA